MCAHRGGSPFSYPPPPALPFHSTHILRPPIRRHALHWSPYQKKMERDPLSDDHRDKMCLYSAFSSRRMKLFRCSDGRAAQKKRILCEIDGFSSKRRWGGAGGLGCLSNCCLSQQKSARRGREDLIPADDMGLSVLVCARTYVSRTFILASVSVCDRSMKSRRPIANRISWVDSRSLSLPIDFFFSSPIPIGPLGGSGRGESGVWKGGRRITAERRYLGGFGASGCCFGCQLKSNKSKLSEVNRCSFLFFSLLPPSRPWWKIRRDVVSSGNPLIDPIDEWLMQRVSAVATFWGRWCSFFLPA